LGLSDDLDNRELHLLDANLLLARLVLMDGVGEGASSVLGSELEARWQAKQPFSLAGRLER
jgi:hypothetical protein